jgi:hypothetical protein
VVVLLSSTQLRATVPAGATSGHVRVVTADGSAESTTNYTVTSAAAAVLFAPSLLEL